MAPKKGAEPPPDEEDGEVDPYAEVKQKAFRAIVNDDVTSLNEVTSSLTADVWQTFENKGRRNMLAMAKERKAPAAHASLVSLLMESPTVVSGEESMSKVFDAVFKCYSCHPDILTRLRDLKNTLAEVPTEIWSTWRNDSGQSLLAMARETFPCNFCDCRYADIPPGGNEFCSTGRGHETGRPGALEILTQEISLAKEELKHRLESAEAAPGEPQQLKVRIQSGEEADAAPADAAGETEEGEAEAPAEEDAGEFVEVPSEPGITVGKFRTRFLEARSLRDPSHAFLTCHGRDLDEDADDLPIEWWTAWGEGDGLSAVLTATEPCELDEQAPE